MAFSPLELLEKLAALVPPKGMHLVRYHGVLGPSHEWREAVLPPAPPEEEDCGGRREIEPWDGEEEERAERRGQRKRKETDWAALIRRSLKLDVLSCPKCGGRMTGGAPHGPWPVQWECRACGHVVVPSSAEGGAA